MFQVKSDLMSIYWVQCSLRHSIMFLISVLQCSCIYSLLCLIMFTHIFCKFAIDIVQKVYLYTTGRNNEKPRLIKIMPCVVMIYNNNIYEN